MALLKDQIYFFCVSNTVCSELDEDIGRPAFVLKHASCCRMAFDEPRYLPVVSYTFLHLSKRLMLLP